MTHNSSELHSIYIPIIPLATSLKNATFATMELRAQAYIPINKFPAIIAEELLLFNKEIIQFSSKTNIDDFGFNKTTRQEYSFKILDRHVKLFNSDYKSSNYIEISFKKDNMPTSVYIDIKHKKNLKKMNGCSWYQIPQNKIAEYLGSFVKGFTGIYIGWMLFVYFM